MSFQYSVEILEKSHQRDAFESGSDDLDRYFKKQASQDKRRLVSNCFVAVTPERQVVGFYTLASTSVPLSDLPAAQTKKLPPYPLIPAALLGRLAVSRFHQGMGLGGELLADAIRRTLRADLACYALIVHAKDQAAVDFYRHHQFIAFQDRPKTLYLPLKGLLA